MLQSGLNIEPNITHRFPLEDYKQAFQLMESGQ
jgi:threonine 3-dehydrogenase